MLGDRRALNKGRPRKREGGPNLTVLLLTAVVSKERNVRFLRSSLLAFSSSLYLHSFYLRILNTAVVVPPVDAWPSLFLYNKTSNNTKNGIALGPRCVSQPPCLAPQQQPLLSNLYEACTDQNIKVLMFCSIYYFSYISALFTW